MLSLYLRDCRESKADSDIRRLVIAIETSIGRKVRLVPIRSSAPKSAHDLRVMQEPRLWLFKTL